MTNNEEIRRVDEDYWRIFNLHLLFVVYLFSKYKHPDSPSWPQVRSYESQHSVIDFKINLRPNGAQNWVSVVHGIIVIQYEILQFLMSDNWEHTLLISNIHFYYLFLNYIMYICFNNVTFSRTSLKDGWHKSLHIYVIINIYYWEEALLWSQ